MGAVEKILSRIVGQTTTIRVEWTDDAPETAAGGPTQSAQGAGQQRQLRAELMQIPCVKKASEVLGAQIIRADEGFGAAANTPATPAEDTSEGE
jgi:hypothetical protein